MSISKWSGDVDLRLPRFYLDLNLVKKSAIHMNIDFFFYQGEISLT